MKKSRFTESQIVAILKEGEAGVAVAQLTRKHGISAATYYHWKSKYGGAAVSELKRLRELEAENAKLKRMYADLALENTAIKDVLSRNIWSAPDLQGLRRTTRTVCVNVSGLSRVKGGCPQAMMRCARTVPIKLLRAASPFSDARLTERRSTVSSSSFGPRKL